MTGEKKLLSQVKASRAPLIRKGDRYFVDLESSQDYVEITEQFNRYITQRRVNPTKITVVDVHYALVGKNDRDAQTQVFRVSGHY